MLALLDDILDQNIDAIDEMIRKDFGGFIITLAITFLIILLMVLVYVFFVWVSIQISRKIFAFIQKKRGRKIHLQFAENLTKAAIIFIFIVIPLAGDQIRKSILGSAAVIAAIVGFAAQDIIQDVLSGLLISIYKPFDLGDRIELEDGTSGIVERITMRHVVVTLVDTVRLVIPNSKLNSAALKNYSYDYVPRSAQFKFPVGYNSDIEKTKEIIEGAVEESSYSVPGKRNKNGEKIYSPVYFISLEDSALMMMVTVYYDHATPTEVLKDDINTRVYMALENAGIEVPYPHETVLLKQ
ncbi:mechanosensitive ion channel family protein [Butyrivibrio sp. LC3010]|uniref:mechanosensitive ion channel family protein n=1 Tax=Butyrivibrio sp. LC3010 TaxID=1280680 RepID=UPI00042813AF|nr:mechanosensitive ion channel family protein [Butyrivibrio sp. LC3010]